MANADSLRDIDLKDILEIILKRKWLIVIVIMTAVFLTAIVNFFLLAPIYETKVMMMVTRTSDQQKQNMNENDTLEGLANNLSAFPQMTLNTYLGQVKNDNLLESVVSSLQLEGGAYAIENLNKRIFPSIIKDSNLIEIKVADKNPALAALIANTLSEEFIKFISAKNKERMNQSVAVFQEQIAVIEIELDTANKELQELNRQPRSVSIIQEELKSRLVDLTTYQSSLVQTNIELEQLHASGRQVEYKLAAGQAKATTLASTISMLEADIEALQGELSAKQGEYNKLLREVERLERNHGLFTERLVQTQIFGSVDIGESSILIVSPALQPVNPVKPRKILNIAISFAAGLLAAVIMALALDFSDNSIVNAEDIRSHLGLTVIGSIPKMKARWKN